MNNYYARAWYNYANFSGTSTRAEYWVFALVNLLLAGTFAHLDSIFSINIDGTFAGPLYLLYALATFIPSLAIVVRRLRDSGSSPALIFLGLVPAVGAIILIILLCKKSSSDQESYLGEGSINDDLLDSQEIEDDIERTSEDALQKSLRHQLLYIYVGFGLFNRLLWKATQYIAENGSNYEIYDNMSFISQIEWGALNLSLPFLVGNRTVRIVLLALVIAQTILDLVSTVVMDLLR